MFAPALTVFILSFAFVFAIVQAATTVSTSITTGGDLSVTGATTLSGNVTLGDANTDIALFTGKLHASTTALFTGVATHYETVNLYNSSTAGTATEGGIYYDSDDKLIKLYDGTDWVNVATSTGGSGLTVSGTKMQLTSLTTYLTIGTTTQSGLSQLTLEATSTVAIPLTIRGYNGQIADHFRIHNVAGTELFAIDSQGRASTTGFTVTGTGNSWFNGFATTTGTNGNFVTQGSIGAGGLAAAPATAIEAIGTASSTGLMVGGGGGGTAITRILHGTCNLTSYAVLQATSTGWHDCAVSGKGVSTSDGVLMQLTNNGTTSMPFVITAARASTTVGYIGAELLNLSGAGTSSYSLATTSVRYWIFK